MNVAADRDDLPVRDDDRAVVGHGDCAVVGHGVRIGDDGSGDRYIRPFLTVDTQESCRAIGRLAGSERRPVPGRKRSADAAMLFGNPPTPTIGKHIRKIYNTGK